jgi:hypothetical protein
MPINSTVPFLGEKCGRRERESRREGRREQSLRDKVTPSRVVAVKGILVLWKAASFAGCCRNEGLGRSVSSSGYPPNADDAPMTADVRRTPRRGTSSACAHKKRMHSSVTHVNSVHALRGRVLHSVLRPVHVDPRYASRRKPRWRGGGGGITAGQTCASRRNQHWGHHHRTKRSSPRVTASARKRA